MPDEFYGDETLLTSHKISSFYILALSAKLMIFNIMKPSIKLVETGLSFFNCDTSGYSTLTIFLPLPFL